MARKQAERTRTKEEKPPTTASRKKHIEQAEEPTTPAQEWGERRASGKIIETGGHSAGINPAQPDKKR